MEIKNKKILIAGFGKSGRAAAVFLKKRKAYVAVSDRKKLRPQAGIKFISEKDVAGRLTGFDMLVLSPGVHPDAGFIREAKKRKIKVFGEFELACLLMPKRVRKVLVTGTNGKSTVTALIHKVLTEGGVKSVLCGNIGIPVFGILESLGGGEVLTVETSSYNLERHAGRSFTADVGILLNISPDHLSRYKSIREYTKVKKRVFEGLGRHGTGISGITAARGKNIFSLGGDLFFRGSKIAVSGRFMKRFPLSRGVAVRAESMKLVFEANRYNILAAYAAGAHFGVSDAAFSRALEKFRPLEHRMEPAGNYKGRYFINDSKATNVSSVEFALASMRAPLVLIMGGRDKGSPYRPLVKYMKKTRALVAYGESTGRIKSELGRFARVIKEEKFEDACGRAVKISRPGDTVMLSPGGSSFDQFRDFVERGNAFKKWIRNLIRKSS